MIPFLKKWATNIFHAAGADPWSAQPTKAEPAAGKLATGRVPEERPPAEETNYWRSTVSRLVNVISSLRTGNFFQADTTGIDGVTAAVPQSAYFDPSSEYFWVVAPGGGGGCEDHWSQGGLVWNAAAPGGLWAALVLPRDCAIDVTTSARAVVFADAADTIHGSAAFWPGIWGLWAGLPGPALTFELVEHDWIGRFVFVTSLGAVYDSTDVLTPIAVAGTPPGFAAALPSAIIHTHHAALDVWDRDTGNPLWMIVTPTEVSTAADGQNWTAAALHNVTALTPRTLAYSKTSRKFGVIQGTAGNARFWESVDNGATWGAGTVIDSAYGALAQGSSLTCDGGGHWVAMLVDGIADARIYVSVDDGTTWERVYPEASWPVPLAAATFAFSTAVYGQGRFQIYTADGAALTTFGYFTTPRALS